MINPATFLLIFVSVSLNALAQIFMRKAMLIMAPLPPIGQFTKLIIAFAANIYLWGGMVSYAVSIGLWLAVLSRVQVSVAYPMLSIGYILAAIMSVVFLGEAVGLTRILGIGLICAGVFFVARS
jgi:drug/metabolite transporter (DMT)-like permease